MNYILTWNNYTHTYTYIHLYSLLLLAIVQVVFILHSCLTIEVRQYASGWYGIHTLTVIRELSILSSNFYKAWEFFRENLSYCTLLFLIIVFSCLSIWNGSASAPRRFTLYYLHQCLSNFLSWRTFKTCSSITQTAHETWDSRLAG